LSRMNNNRQPRAEKQEAQIRREKKGRGGKTVTVVRNLQLTSSDLKALGKQLRQACGSGGTVKDGAIEIQGDHRERVAAVLGELGYKVKFTGG
jgi:translation initiation factor 1